MSIGIFNSEDQSLIKLASNSITADETIETLNDIKVSVATDKASVAADKATVSADKADIVSMKSEIANIKTTIDETAQTVSENANSVQQEKIAIDETKTDIDKKYTEISNTASKLNTEYNNLTSNYYTKEATNSLISSTTKPKYSVVNELPTSDISTDIIYLKSTNTTSTDGIYEMYTYQDSNWVKIGTSNPDLADYYTKELADSTFATKTEINNTNTEVSELKEDLVELQDICIEKSVNLYDSSKQTSETISPHYFVDGVPYSDTRFDSTFNCTDYIPVEPNTTYTIGLVPSLDEIIKPWDFATNGVFLYDENKNWLKVYTSGNNTFTTTNETRYIRFNYRITGTFGLDAINERCMLVIGNTLPSEYTPYININIKETISKIENEIKYINTGTITLKEDETYYVLNKCNDKYIITKLEHCNANNLFQIHSLGYCDFDGYTFTNVNWFIDNYGSDMVGPVSMKKKDASGNPEWSGGNHSKTVDGVICKTARERSFKVYCGGVDITNEPNGIYYGYATFIVENELYYPSTIIDNSFTDAEIGIIEKRIYKVDKYINVEVSLDFQNDTYVDMYYGMQSQFFRTISKLYVDSMETEYTYSDGSSNGLIFDKETNRYVAYIDDMWRYEMCLGYYGLGKHEKLLSTAIGYGSISWGKIYHHLISGCNVDSGKILKWNGTYKLIQA